MTNKQTSLPAGESEKGKNLPATAAITPDAIIRAIKAAVTATKKMTPAAAIGELHKIIQLSNSANQICVEARLLVGQRLAQLKEECEHGELIEAYKNNGFTRQRAAELIGIYETFSQMSAARTFATENSWRTLLECQKLTESEINSLVSGGKVRGITRDTIGDYSYRQLRLTFAEGASPEVIKLQSENQKHKEDKGVLRTQLDFARQQNKELAASTAGEKHAVITCAQVSSAISHLETTLSLLRDMAWSIEEYGTGNSRHSGATTEDCHYARAKAKEKYTFWWRKNKNRILEELRHISKMAGDET
ncbi:hypothetical protein NQX30_04735 [Candidatus Persebacteraceae bacterium Df01]|jgi:hypothetical protein|uniref:Uncharacterized protein n=1 Tax=Candidatus Doriopsillibacter californiensis TaxID=2970740 RepID=A0ABT7QM35_9GAMM|nr:hypothetical protein [Candidatus Persebacteraceae bacterium Df01]